MTNSVEPFIQWLDETNRKSDFNYLYEVYSDELELARKMFDCKPAWDAAKTYFEQLKPSFTCDADEAENLIREGKALYKESRDFVQAVYLFTRAIYKAPTDSPQLARAHANRATVLCKLHYYEAAYEDCICALELNHPSTKTLLAKQAVIAWQLKDQQKLQESLKRFKAFNIEVPNRIQNFLGQLQTSHSPTRRSEEDPVSKFPKFNKIKLSKNIERGRFYTAVDTIDPGELILEDVAAAFIPQYGGLQGNRSLFSENDTVFTCDNCAENDIVPFPCYECRSVFYCSKKCFQEHKSCHRFECRGYKLTLFNSIFQCRVGFRCFLLSFVGILRDIQNTKEVSVDNTAKVLWSMILETGKEGTLLGLHSDFQKIQRDFNAVSYGLNAFLLIFYLSHQTDFFEDMRTERMALLPSDNDWHVIVTALILRFTFIWYINVFSCNAYVPRKPFTKRKIDSSSLSAMFTVDAKKSALFCWNCFFNHSCYSNAVPVHTNSKMEVYSRRRITKGEEVTIDYLHDSALRSREKRQCALMQYHECHCERCLNEEDPIYVKSVGIPCACGGTCFIFQENSACKECSKNCREKFFFDLILMQQQIECCPEKYIYLYGICAILKKSLEDCGFRIFSAAAQDILREFLWTTNKEVLGDERINGFMIKLAVDLLQITKNNYFPLLKRAEYAVMLIDLLSMRKARGFQELKFKHNDLIEGALLAITEKPRKIIDAVFKMNCF